MESRFDEPPRVHAPAEPQLEAPDCFSAHSFAKLLTTSLSIAILCLCNFIAPQLLWKNSYKSIGRWYYRSSLQRLYDDYMSAFDELKVPLAFIAIGGFIAQVLTIAVLTNRRSNATPSRNPKQHKLAHASALWFPLTRFALGGLLCFVITLFLGVGIQSAASESFALPGSLMGLSLVLALYTIAYIGVGFAWQIANYEIIGSLPKHITRSDAKRQRRSIGEIFLLTAIVASAFAVSESAHQLYPPHLDMDGFFVSPRTLYREIKGAEISWGTLFVTASLFAGLVAATIWALALTPSRHAWTYSAFVLGVGLGAPITLIACSHLSNGNLRITEQVAHFLCFLYGFLLLSFVFSCIARSLGLRVLNRTTASGPRLSSQSSKEIFEP